MRLVKLILPIISLSILILTLNIANANIPAVAADKYPLTDFSKPIYVKNGAQAITINLPTNPSTGYQWYLLQYDDKLLDPLAYHYIPIKMRLPGAPGVSTWQFQLKKGAFQVPRVTHVEFEYRRSWEAASGNRQSLTVIISPNAD